MTKIKICGVKEPRHVIAACEEGADYLGMVFYEKSPRFLTDSQAAKIMGITKEHDIQTVALTANADNDLIEKIVKLKPDYIQFHGDEDELHIKSLKLGDIKIIQVVKIANKDDVKKIAAAKKYADIILLDAKPDENDSLPGGNARAFDWSLLAGEDLQDCLLAGGLDADNIVTAIAACKPFGVDVSSGVEKSYGVKCSRKIRKFIRTARGT